MAGRTFLRNKTYHIALSYKGVEHRRSALTNKKREAELLLAYYLGQVARGEFKGFGSRLTYTLFEMLDDFADDYDRRGMRDSAGVGFRIKHLKEYFQNIAVEDITERHVDLYIKHRAAQGRKRTTINRETQVLGQAMRLAKRKKLIKDVPYIQKFSEKGNERQGFFEREEFEKIVALLPSYLQDVARFAYWTGWRRQEVLTLMWDDIHHNAIHLKPERDKSKDGRYIPLMGEIATIIARQQRVPECPYVFHRRGARIVTYRQAWSTARKKAGLPDKLFHDMRRTVARNLDNTGVPREVAKRIIGHKTDEMYSRYRIVSQKDIEAGMHLYLEKTAHETDR